MGRKCAVCASKDRQEIDRLLINLKFSSKTYRTLSQVFGVSVYSLGRHRKNHINALLAKSREVREVLNKESVFKDLNELYNRMKKLSNATDELLADPDDPQRYVIGSSAKAFAMARARAEDIMIYYQRFLNGRVIQRKQNLDLILEQIESKGGTRDPIAVTNVHYKAESVLKTAREAAMAAKEFQQLYLKWIGEIKEKEIVHITQIMAKIKVVLERHPKEKNMIIHELEKEFEDIEAEPGFEDMTPAIKEIIDAEFMDEEEFESRKQESLRLSGRDKPVDKIKPTTKPEPPSPQRVRYRCTRAHSWHGKRWQPGQIWDSLHPDGPEPPAGSDDWEIYNPAAETSGLLPTRR